MKKKILIILAGIIISSLTLFSSNDAIAQEPGDTINVYQTLAYAQSNSEIWDLDRDQYEELEGLLLWKNGNQIIIIKDGKRSVWDMEPYSSEDTLVVVTSQTDGRRLKLGLIKNTADPSVLAFMFIGKDNHRLYLVTRFLRTIVIPDEKKRL